MQTDNILILANNPFANIKNDAIRSVKIMIKNKEYLTPTYPLKFNSVQIKIYLNKKVLTKKSYIKVILLVTNHAANSISSTKKINKKLLFKKQYLARKAKEAYIAPVCQPEAFFNFFQAIQTVKFILDNIAMLNKRLQWQITNKYQGFRYIKSNQETLQLVVFSNFLFANNKDMLLQIGYVICLENRQTS